ncbi:MAG: flagellar export chaperone FliS [Thermodesulfobacteriota bacterium]
MTYTKMIGQYRKTNVETAGKLDLILMCYEKSMEFIGRARLHYQHAQYEEKGNSLTKALEIINALQSCLDFEKGGQIARNLDGLYCYLTRRLLEGDIRKDMKAFDEAIGILSELKEAWQQIAMGQISETEPGRQIPHARPGLEQLAA